MNPLDTQKNLIIEGFKPGNALVWHVADQKFEVVEKKVSRKLEGYEVTLDKVSEHVKEFFTAHPEKRSADVVETIQARVTPYRGWFGWVLWFTFRCRSLNRILGHFDFLTQSVCAGPLVPLPEGGIRMGISNLGNSCWFNSALKFFASTTVFDHGFNHNDSEIAGLFRTAINELRLGRAGNLDNKTLACLRKAVEDRFKDFNFGRQCDCDEFIRLLMDEIWDVAGSNLKTLEDVRAREGLERFFSESTNQFTLLEQGLGKKAPTSDQFKGFVIVPLDEDDLKEKGGINLSDVLARESGFDAPIEADDHERYEFSRLQRFTHLPNVILLKLDRAIRSGQNNQGRDAKCDRPVTLEANSTLTFPLYRLEGRELVFVEDKVYRVDAAITHYGGMWGGHYVCDTRNPDGSITHHSDSSVSQITDPIGAQAVFFCLTLVP